MRRRVGGSRSDGADDRFMRGRNADGCHRHRSMELDLPGHEWRRDRVLFGAFDGFV